MTNVTGAVSLLGIICEA